MDGYNLILVIISCLAFFVLSFVENFVRGIPDLFRVFFKLFTTKSAWLNLSFAVGTATVLEIAYRAIRKVLLEDVTLQYKFKNGHFETNDVANR